SITAEQVNNGSSDNCSIASITIDKTNFTCADVGPNTVTLTVTDPSGNTTTTTAIVTVEDATPPTALAQDLTIALDENGLASLTTAEVNNGSTDNCGIASIAIDQATFDCAAVGENTVTLTVTDINGNTDSATAIVTVVDDIPPTLECQDVTVALDENGFVSGNPFINGALVSRSDNCQVQGGVGVTGPNQYDCSFLGENFVTIFQSDVNGNQVSCSYVLTIIDDSAPTAITQDITVQLDASGNVSITPEQVNNGSSDNCSTLLALDKTDFTCADVGPNTVTLTVTDPSGNTDSTTAIVTVEDTTPPEIFCEDVTVELDENGRGSYPLADVFFNSSDNCDISFVGINGGFYDCDDLGEQTVTIFVDDPSGNRSTCQPNVKVVDLIAPLVQTQDVTIALDSNGVASITKEDIDAGTTDNCSLAELSIDRSEFTCADLGTNTVTLTATDLSGNSTSVTAFVTVIDQIPPVVMAQDLTVALDSSGRAMITPLQIDNGSFDNCSADLTLDVTEFSCADLGPNTVTLTATDSAGNISSSTATVIVEDATPPTLVTKSVVVVLDESGRAIISELDIDDGSTDNCSGSLHFNLSQTEFDCEDLGINPITVRAFDDAGNESSTEVLISVEDQNPPTVKTQDIVVSLDLATGSISITPEDIDDGSSDNCTIVDKRLDISTFDCLAVGENTVTLTIEDQSGNEASAVAQVTIVVDGDIIPNAVCQDITVALDENGQATITASDLDGGSTDICGIQSFSLSQSTFSCEDLGSNEVEFKIQNQLGNESTCIANVTVIDEMAPTLVNIPRSPVVFEVNKGCSANVDLSELGITAEDNCGRAKVSFAPSSGIFAVSDSAYQFTATARDAAGNTTVATFEVLIRKKTPFISITSLTGRTGLARISGIYDQKEITSLLIDWGDGSAKTPLTTRGFLFEGSHRYRQPGQYIVTIDFTNSCGTTDQLTRTVLVEGGLLSIQDPKEVLGDRAGESIVGTMELITYPNPFTRKLNVRFTPNVLDVVEVVIYSLEGKEIHRMFAGEVQAAMNYNWSFESTELLSSGMYLIKIKGASTDLTRRVLFERRLIGPNGR
ncbi:MAG: T9SS type A sorting domain-containing protein, partial [Bacteroidota bacterium]